MPLPFIAVESFLDPDLAAKVWPESIAANPVFLEQLIRRKELNERLEVVINSLPRPDMPLAEGQAAKMYESLSNLLESDPDYRRIVLYLPFEFLPKAPTRFRQAYMKVWERLLYVHDVRANFTDGDVLEVEQRTGDLPRVVKAAHLIPRLVENGLIEVKDVLRLMEETDDQTLKDSIADALPVLADLGFLAEKEIKPRERIVTPEDYDKITERRKAWLKQREEQKIFRQLRQLGMAELNTVVPKLAGPFSENLKLMDAEMRDIRKMAASIESNPELSHLIYPAVLVFGSRLNGYGEQNSDIDIAVLVRQGTPFSRRLELQKLLKKTFAHEKIKGDEIKEFWLEEKENQLKVRDFIKYDVSLGKSYWTHLLFGAAWLGDENAIRELYEKLLVPYMHDTKARRLYIEDMEQGTLQYRLMHKGYERFFPPYGGMRTPHSDGIDGNSMFWDSGYRQLATRLFASRVFLPKIPINKS